MYSTNNSFNLLILNVNANFGGASHDAFIWRNSGIKQHMEENYAGGDQNSWLIGDSGYPQEPWIMTPFRGVAKDTPVPLFLNLGE